MVKVNGVDYSPKKPANASIATRPCFSSASLYLMNSLSVSGQSERGSKNPKGAVTPAAPLGSKTVFSEVAKDEVSKGRVSS